jgi:hypothetical protein
MVTQQQFINQDQNIEINDIKQTKQLLINDIL